jgi:uncharacterized SAM-binding protein YcdF (DUF218 family)
VVDKSIRQETGVSGLTSVEGEAFSVFIIKKILSAFLLPPGCFIVVLIGGGIWLLSRKRLKSAILTLTVGVLLWLASMPAMASLAVKGLERGLTIPRELKGDVIILLGGEVKGDVKDLTGKGAPSEEMLGRMVTAVRAQKKTGLPLLVSGGSLPGMNVTDSWVVQRFLTDLGVPPEKIIIEYKSRDTEENARYIEELCSRYGFRNPLLITSASHMKRSLLTFQRYGLAVTPLPSDFMSPGTWRFHLLQFLPKSTALELTTTAFHEYIGIIYYRLTLPEVNWPGN